MREILLRGKSLDNCEWIEGYLVVNCFTKEHSIVTEFSIDDDSYGICAEKVIPETVGQFTGLRDKNGNKVFEGDIITCDFGLAKWHKKIVLGAVEFHQGCYVINSEKHGLLIPNGDIEILGNIFDNPELLEENPDCKVENAMV